MSKSISPARTLQKLSVEKPVLTGLVLLLVASFFRLIDIFGLRLDERLGEIILSKSLGFALVVFFVWRTGRKLKDIGLHSRFLHQSLFTGILITAIALIFGYGIEFAIQLQYGSHPVLHFDAIDPKAGVSGGVLFAVWLVMGNLVNSFMEEGLFRGLMIRLFKIRLSFSQTNWLQALLFGAWHLPWALKWYQIGKVVTAGEITFAIVANFLPQLGLGIAWGYLYLKTDNLWASWIAHTLANSTLNLLHITTVEGLDSGMTIRIVVYVIVSLLSLFLVKYIAKEFQMPEAKPWDEQENTT